MCEDRDAFAAMSPEYISQLGAYSVQQIPIAFAFSYDVMDISIYEGVIVVRMSLF